MATHPYAGKPVPPHMLADIDAIRRAYTERVPDPGDARQRVSFGTSGHRGSSTATSFNEAHVLAITQALCEVRSAAGIDGPLFIGADTHALSEQAHATTLEVLVANGVDAVIQGDGTPTPTPAISHAILTANRKGSANADGIVITPSHNPPADGGFKYNPPHGGPADVAVTGAIEARANELLADGNRGVRRTADTAGVRHTDFVEAYVADLPTVIDIDLIRKAGVKIGAHPLGGTSLAYWERIEAMHRLDITLVSREIDPQFSFMCVDRDGVVRMDCSSRYAMAGLIELRDRFDLAFGNDPDADRHGIVTPDGLMNPNHYLAVCVDYLLQHRPDWDVDAGVGKTLVSSSMIDRVVAAHGRRLVEVPVGFKWFVNGLSDGSIVFGGEESAGASFLRFDGTPWSTDKDGIILCLLAAEMQARTGKSPSQRYAELEARHGSPVYRRIEAPANTEQKARLKRLSPEDVTADSVAGDPVRTILTRAPGNDAAIGGLKVTTDRGWFAARPSGTEDIYKIYAESFESEAHLDHILADAQRVVGAALGATPDTEAS